MKKYVFILFSALFSCLYVFAYDCEESDSDFQYHSSQFSRKNCSKDSIDQTYTYATVRDSVLMDLIIDATNNVINNDSLYNLVKSAYFKAWDRSKKLYTREISVDCRDGLMYREDDINEQFIPEGFDRSILHKRLLTITVYLSYYEGDEPYERYYTNYKGLRYFFGNTLLITPTQQTMTIRRPRDNDDWLYGLYNYLEIHFFYYDGKLYLNPTIEIWNCYR